MAINLNKGDRISLDKAGGAGLSRVVMGLGWGLRRTKGMFGFGTKEVEVDLDASCLLFQGKQMIDEVWFRQLRSQCGAVQHSGDDRSGGGGGDNERITVDLKQLPPGVDSLIFTVNSFLNDSFEGIPNATCRLLDAAGNKVLATFDLSLDGGASTGMIMARLYREGGAWNMQAIGEPGRGRTFQDLLPQIERFV